MPNALNVSAAKPAVGGVAYVAPLGSTLPTDATTALDAAFVELGYLSEDGITNSTDISSNTIKEMGGKSVLTTQESKDDGFSFTLIEALNMDVLKTIYGSTNVTGTVSTGAAVSATSEELDDCAWVFEILMRGDVLKRIVIPIARISDLGDISYTGSDAIGYEVTLAVSANSSGVNHYEYLKG